MKTPTLEELELKFTQEQKEYLWKLIIDPIEKEIKDNRKLVLEIIEKALSRYTENHRYKESFSSYLKLFKKTSYLFLPPYIICTSIDKKYLNFYKDKYDRYLLRFDNLKTPVICFPDILEDSYTPNIKNPNKLFTQDEMTDLNILVKNLLINYYHKEKNYENYCNCTSDYYYKQYFNSLITWRDLYLENKDWFTKVYDEFRNSEEVINEFNENRDKKLGKRGKSERINNLLNSLKIIKEHCGL